MARATYPMRRAFGDFVDYFPCSVIGHHWVERRQRGRRPVSDVGGMADRRMSFHCSRCRTPADFTN